MKERIVFAPGVGGSALLKSMAANGVNCFNVRVFSAEDLANYALTKAGITVEADYINRTEENIYIVKALNDEKYFGKISYNDVLQISDAIRKMRGLVAGDNEEKSIKNNLSKGQFEEKNKALYSVYKNYIQLIKKENKIDGISFLRFALEKAQKCEAEFVTVREFPATPLEKALLNKLSDGTTKEISIKDLFDAKAKKLHISKIRKCYGASNEVETLLTEIYSDKKLDQCTVAVTDTTTYSQLFFDYSLLYGIPVTFGCGVPIMNSNPAKLLVLYYKWITGGFYGTDSLDSMLNSEAFDITLLYDNFEENSDFDRRIFRETLGFLRLTDNPEINEQRIGNYIKSIELEEKNISKESKDYDMFLKKKACISALEIVSKELSLPTEDFILKYAYIRKPGKTNSENLLRKVDLAALDVIVNELKVIKGSGINQETDDIIKNVLSHNVCVQSSEEGCLHITEIGKAFSSLRKNIYIVGLSALRFPGSPKENYLLLDEDLDNFGEEAKIYSSNGKIIRKKELLISLAELAASFECELSLSYSGLNVSELKKENASSLIFELFSMENKNAESRELEEKIEEIAYFEPKISITREIGMAYNDGKQILFSESNTTPDAVSVRVEKYYSPSAINNYFSCPRLFYLANLLEIPEPQSNDPFEVISAADRGKLAHSLMEKLANNEMTEKEFISLAENEIDCFLLQKTPLIDVNANAIKDDFISMMSNAYRTDTKRRVVLAEEDIYCEHESGVRIHGFPDRVEEMPDGSYLVVDYKTGATVKHVQDDINTCLQVVMYAYLMEHKKDNPLSISGGEFRYIKVGQNIDCKYDDEIKGALNDKLAEFKSGLESGEFPISSAAFDTDGGSPCKFCKYISVCGRNEEN